MVKVISPRLPHGMIVYIFLKIGKPLGTADLFSASSIGPLCFI